MQTKMTKLIILLLIVLSLFVAGCTDNTKAIQHCDSLGLQYTGKILGCNVECINVTSGQLFTYNAECKFIRR